MKALAPLLLVISLLVASPVLAQRKGEDTTTRSVQGAVTDASNALVDGAVVKLKDTKTLQIRSFITKADGMYFFQGLNPNIDYEVQAEHQGSASGLKTLSSFDSRKQAVINLKLEVKK